jgi:hypothetical protein
MGLTSALSLPLAPFLSSPHPGPPPTLGEGAREREGVPEGQGWVRASFALAEVIP